MPIVLGSVGAIAIALAGVLLALGINLDVEGAHMAAMGQYRLAVQLLIGGVLLLGVGEVIVQLRRLAGAQAQRLAERRANPNEPGSLTI